MRHQLKINGPRTISELLREFEILDGSRKGVLKNKQFAFALSKIAALKLDPSELRSVMIYFDRTGTMETIDYHAFISFLRYIPPPRMRAVEVLDKMILSSTSAGLFRKEDPTGHGYIRRADMHRVLATLGYSSIADKKDMFDMLVLFETKEEGLVNYANFIEYVRENEMCRLFDEVQIFL